MWNDLFELHWELIEGNAFRTPEPAAFVAVMPHGTPYGRVLIDGANVCHTFKSSAYGYVSSSTDLSR